MEWCGNVKCGAKVKKHPMSFSHFRLVFASLACFGSDLSALQHHLRFLKSNMNVLDILYLPPGYD